jgi:methylmalonyl-CoA carboxyltransferase 5S subunit
MAKELMDLGCDSLCVKDIAALLKPQPAYDIVKAIKESLDEQVHIHVHGHATTGVTLVSLMKSIEAGADVVDTSISSLSLGPGHNPTESLVEMLEGTEYDTKLDMARLLKLKDHIATIRPRYKEFLSNITGVETEMFQSQIPGGMISNMESQLKQRGAGDRTKEALLEVPRVRKDAGYPPLVTPSSQIVGTQAVFNVLMGRHKVITAEFADPLLGCYRKTLGERDLQVTEQCEKQAKKAPITRRPADFPKPEWEQLRAAANALDGCDGTDEHVLTCALFPKVAPKFFAERASGPKSVAKDRSAASAAGTGDGLFRAPENDGGDRAGLSGRSGAGGVKPCLRNSRQSRRQSGKPPSARI